MKGPNGDKPNTLPRYQGSRLLPQEKDSGERGLPRCSHGPLTYPAYLHGSEMTGQPWDLEVRRLVQVLPLFLIGHLTLQALSANKIVQKMDTNGCNIYG